MGTISSSSSERMMTFSFSSSSSITVVPSPPPPLVFLFEEDVVLDEGFSVADLEEPGLGLGEEANIDMDGGEAFDDEAEALAFFSVCFLKNDSMPSFLSETGRRKDSD